MIADLVVTVVVYREGGHFQAICPEFGVEATGQSSGDAKEEVLAAVRRHLDGIAFRGQLADYLAEAGFVVDSGVLRAERRLVEVDEGRVTIVF